MILKTHYDLDKNNLTVEVDVTFIQQLPGSYKLAVMLAEDHVLSWQKNNEPSIGPTPDWENYEQRNVLRGSISDNTFGISLTPDGTIVPDETYRKRFSYELESEWVAENCNVIAYVIHDDSGDILQVAELGVNPQ
jgi:hypothetical protein